MKEGLVHIKKQYDDGDYIDIADEKIYYDSTSGQYKHKFKCSCGTDMGCFCFDSVSDVREGIDTGLTCDECCAISEFLGESLHDDLLLQMLIDERMFTNFVPVNTIMDCIECRTLLSDADDDFRYKVIDFLLDDLEKMITEVRESYFSEGTKKELISFMNDRKNLSLS
ncbi:MAG: hypothetical protein PWQ51_1812 [Methanolobus sp.]|jgi:hypothetical protein|nr:hypothetical protein [Methanolobus sp.]